MSKFMSEFFGRSKAAQPVETVEGEWMKYLTKAEQENYKKASFSSGYFAASTLIQCFCGVSMLMTAPLGFGIASLTVGVFSAAVVAANQCIKSDFKMTALTRAASGKLSEEFSKSGQEIKSKLVMPSLGQPPITIKRG